MSKQSLRAVLRIAPALALVGVVGACGDAPTTDTRGYTKAPLENPGLIIEAEPTTEMSELREPLRPPVVELERPAP